MLKLLRRKSFRKSKEFKPGSKSTLNSSSGSVSNAGGSYYIRPQRRSSGDRKVSHNTDTSQNSLNKSIGSHRYSSVNLGSPVPAPEIVQYSRPPENLTSPVRESLENSSGCSSSQTQTSASGRVVKTKELNAVSQVMNVISAVRNADETAARLRTGNVMPTPRCLPPTPKRSTGHSQRPSAQALPTPSTVHSTAEAVIPKPSARMSLRTKVEKNVLFIFKFSRWDNGLDTFHIFYAMPNLFFWVVATLEKCLFSSDVRMADYSRHSCGTQTFETAFFGTVQQRTCKSIKYP